MVKISTLTLCLLLIALTLATASPRIGHRPEGVCTRDLNPWGHASQCSCKKQDIYDDRAGLCLEDGEVEKITVRGTISSGVVATGGKTPGFVIHIPEGAFYELILNVAERNKLQNLTGQWFEVAGEIVLVKSVEVAERRILIVDSIAVLE